MKNLWGDDQYDAMRYMCQDFLIFLNKIELLFMK